MNYRRTMTKSCAAAASLVLLSALAASGDVVRRDIDLSSGKQAGELLDRVIEQYQRGELEGAWKAYRAFFDHPGKNNVSADAFGRCFYQSKCPGIGVLASVLQKEILSAGDFRNFCPDWNDRAPLAQSDENFGESERLLWRFRYGAMNGTCEEWVEENAAWFEPLPPRQDVPEQALLFAPALDGEISSFAFEGDIRPFVEVEIIGTPVKALFDTGATMSRVNTELAQRDPDKVEIIEQVEVHTISKQSREVLARVDRIQIGEARFARPVVTLNTMYWAGSDERVPAEAGNLIGMNLLLQYEEVCFAWEEGKLHLGDLGPCEDGVISHKQWLTGPLGIAVPVMTPAADRVWAKIDTGSPETYCSEWFMENNDGSEAFSFGGGEALVGQCAYDSRVFFNNQERGAESPSRHILIGMDTLGQFAAFGWRLNPLGVYFVPKPQASGLDSS